MINQLENGNRGRAMAKLRVPPLGGVSSPWAILASGWLMGAIFIMAVVAVIACKSKILKIIQYMYFYYYTCTCT